MIITTDDILAIEPGKSYPRFFVARLVGDGITPRQITELTIPSRDRIFWMVYAVLEERERRILVSDCAERMLHRERDAGREPDKRSWAAIEVARRYVRGEATDAELAEAEAAAGAVAAADARVSSSAPAAWVLSSSNNS